jgi:hypothetical protein
MRAQITRRDSLLPAGLLAGLLMLGLAGCSKESPPAPSAAESPEGRALYGVNVDVSYSGDRADLGDGARVFAFLREPGERMPLAVQHFPARDLPRSVSFEGDAEGGSVELVVRLSPTGMVDRSPADVEVTKTLPGFRHPPQTLKVVLNPLGAAPADTSTAAATPPPSTPAISAIRINVRIDDGQPFAPDTVAFVIARQPGSKMPSAVKRLSVGELPTTIELTDADAMTFGNRLSTASSLDLTARVSQSGTASRSDSDWVSDTVQVRGEPPADGVTLTIHPPASR